MKEFKDLLERYCNAHEGWVLTPEICTMNHRKSDNRWVSSDKNLKEQALITSGWVYAQDEYGFKKEPVEYIWGSDVRYIYVYKSVQDIPTRNEDIPRPKKNEPPTAETFQEETF